MDFSDYRTDAFYDELFLPDGTPRPGAVRFRSTYAVRDPQSGQRPTLQPAIGERNSEAPSAAHRAGHP